MNLEEFRAKLVASRLEPRVLSACLAVADLLTDLKPGDGRHLGIPFFYDRLNDADRNWLLPALSILSSRDGAILEMHGYLDDAEEGQLHLSEQEFKDLLDSGRLAHPVSGVEIREPFTQVRVFYSLRDSA